MARRKIGISSQHPTGLQRFDKTLPHLDLPTVETICKQVCGISEAITARNTWMDSGAEESDEEMTRKHPQQPMTMQKVFEVQYYGRKEGTMKNPIKGGPDISGFNPGKV